MKTKAIIYPPYSEDTLCQQLHALYDRLEARRQIILKDPDFNEGNDALMREMERIVKRIALIRECFEEFCPS
ncbi:MAG: hypothetical protein HQM09_09970 [Candidatus Riflebacteria bacterium]|nr:hypothetical protein [Candidatus Riflebacteria bacterium]